jgi:ABC-2 type transport system permease protein
MANAASRIALDIKYSLIQFSRNRQSILFTFIFPIVLFIILGYLLGGSGYIDFLFPGILGMCILFSAVNETMGAIVKYRSSGLFQKITASPLSSIEWNLSRILTGTVVVLLSVMVAFIVALLVFGVRPDINVVLISLVLAGTFIFIGLGMIMSYIVENADSVNSASVTLIIPLMLVSGSLFPVDRLPDYLRFLSLLSPLTYLNEGLRSAMFGGDAGYAMTNLGILIFLGFVLFCVNAAILMGRDGQA